MSELYEYCHHCGKFEGFSVAISCSGLCTACQTLNRAGDLKAWGKGQRIYHLHHPDMLGTIQQCVTRKVKVDWDREQTDDGKILAQYQNGWDLRAVPIPEGLEKFAFIEDYEKALYDVLTLEGEMIKWCWPNAGYFLHGDRQWPISDVKARLSPDHPMDEEEQTEDGSKV